VIKNGRIVGMIALGNIRNSGLMLALSLSGEKLSQVKGTLMGDGILKARKLITIQERKKVLNYY
jgi:hypothetical protein